LGVEEIKMPASLTYSIFEGVLAGMANRMHIHMSAGSGGGSGRRLHLPQQTANNPYSTGLQPKGNIDSPQYIHGGPLPPGRYKIGAVGHYPHVGYAAPLENPFRGPQGRSGFFIHTTGKHGSDGCIVPHDPDGFKKLMAALKADPGGVLFVQESESGDRFA
jgi:hypothetical protein